MKEVSKRYRDLLFDLDGTITDSGEGITKCVQYSLKKFGIDEPDLSKLIPFVGPPLLDSYEKYYGMDEKQAMQAIAFYRERYEGIGIFECRPYEGIDRLLSRLQKEGRRLIVASSKPEAFVKRILEYFGLIPYFSEIVGATMDEKKLSSKPDIIREVFRRCGITEEEKRNMVMIGDRRYDIEGAGSTGIDSIGVYYGFADPGELEAAGATFIAHTVEELSDLFEIV